MDLCLDSAKDVDGTRVAGSRQVHLGFDNPIALIDIYSLLDLTALDSGWRITMKGLNKAENQPVEPVPMILNRPLLGPLSQVIGGQAVQAGSGQGTAEPSVLFSKAGTKDERREVVIRIRFVDEACSCYIHLT